MTSLRLRYIKRYGTLHSLLGFLLSSLLVVCSEATVPFDPFEAMAIGRINITNTATIDPPFHLKPPQMPLDVDEYPVAPQRLDLEQVHVYVRHGERTPVGVRMSNAIPTDWIMCKLARDFKAAAAANVGSAHDPRGIVSIKKAVENGDGTVTPGLCLLGQLTDLGRQSTFDYGGALRKLYIDRLHFLPDILDQEEEVYFRSTHVPRTVESLEYIVNGLYPISKCSTHAMPSILIRNGVDENLVGNLYHCKRLQKLQAAFAQAAADALNPILEPLDSKISKYIHGNPVRIDGHPKASGILDTIHAATAHDIPVPPEFEEDDVMDVLEKAASTEWFEGYKTSEEVRRLGMGPLLSDLVKKMQRKADLGSQDPLKILVHSTHDSTVAGLLSTLDAFDDRWPPFTSSITFELFKLRKERSQQSMSIFQTIFGVFKKSESSTSTDDYYIRTRYKNKNLVLPLCAEEGKHLLGSPEFCSLTAFQKRVEELTPQDWREECSRPEW